MKKNLVVLGGGTGNFTVLQGLKKYPVHLSAVVSMADDGGSTGILRDELGVLPPGDVRQCLVALSTSTELLRSLMSYRFENGGLGGHSFGNILLSALEKVTGSFELAVEEVGKILAIEGKVIPVTTHFVRLKMLLNNNKWIDGEKEIYLSKEIDQGFQKIKLDPEPIANPHAIDAILNADVLIIGPGGLYTSIIPLLLVKGVCDALMQSKAKKIYIANLMNRYGQTSGFKISDYLHAIEQHLHDDFFDYILVNNVPPPQDLIKLYADEGEIIQNDLDSKKVISAPLLGGISQKNKKDLIARNLIRHNSDQLAEEIIKLVDHF